MARFIKVESEWVSESVKFRWKIGNFSEDKLLTDGSSMKSPTFKCLNSTLHLEVSQVSRIFGVPREFAGPGRITLCLVHCSSDEPARISDCTIGFASSDKDDSLLPCSATFSAPPRDIISCSFLASTITEKCVSENALNVHCDFTATTLMRISDDDSRAEMNEDKRSSLSNSGSLVLAESFGKVFEDPYLSDVTLKVGEEEFQAHKVILASRSSVFHGMFESGMKESLENVVEMAEMKASIAKEMLQYIYTGKIKELSIDRALDLYVASDGYDLQELKGWCKDFIMQNISPLDVCCVAELAELHNDEELAKAARRVFEKNFKIIMSSSVWRSFATENPVLHIDFLERVLLNES